MKKKSLNAKKIIPDSFKLIKILKDKKIFEIFRVFEKNFKKLKNTKKIAISVSGGPDSLALAFLAKIFSIKNKLNPKFYIVDHKLRPESTKEAKKVKQILKRYDVK